MTPPVLTPHSSVCDALFPFLRTPTNTLDSASTHLLLAPLLAGLFGLIGGYACSLLQSLHRNGMLLIGGLEITLLLTAIAALHMVSVLARPERPPYVMLGLLALGISMACAHPVFSAVRGSATAK